MCIHRVSALSIFELQSVAIAKHNRDECSKLCGSTVGSAADHRSAAVAASEGDRLTISAEIDQRVGLRMRNLLMFGLRLRHERVGHRRIPSESHRLSEIREAYDIPTDLQLNRVRVAVTFTQDPSVRSRARPGGALFGDRAAPPPLGA